MPVARHMRVRIGERRVLRINLSRPRASRGVGALHKHAAAAAAAADRGHATLTDGLVIVSVGVCVCVYARIRRIRRVFAQGVSSGSSRTDRNTAFACDDTIFLCWVDHTESGHLGPDF